MTTTIVLVDDHAIVRAGLRALLATKSDYSIVAETGDGLEASQIIEKLNPDIVVLDLKLPGLNGLDVLRIMRKRAPSTRAVFFSMYDSVGFVAEALRCGALGYVLKGGPVDEVLNAIQAAMEGKRFLSASLSAATIDAHIEKLKSAGVDRHEMLTPRERQVLQLAAEGATCPQIGTRLKISERTAERHRANLMQKLGLRSQTDLVRYALEHAVLLQNWENP
jgi:DNA-binding NarL/FixJ family response regulator